MLRRAHAQPPHLSALSRSIVAFSLGMVLGVLALTLRDPAAAADSPSCLSPGDAGYVTGREFTDSPQDNDARGTRADLLVAAQDVSCQTIRSVYFLSKRGTAHVEVGWFRGYQNCRSGDTAFRTRATVFVDWVKGDGTHGCQIFDGRHPADGSYPTFEVSDVDGNGFVNTWIDGQQLRSVEAGFSLGWNAVGMERAYPTSSNTGWGRYQQLLENHAGNGWTVWNGLSTWDQYTDDNAYHLVVENTYTGRTVQ